MAAQKQVMGDTAHFRCAEGLDERYACRFREGLFAR